MAEFGATGKGEQAALDGVDHSSALDAAEPPAVLAQARALVVPALRAAVDRLQGEQLRRIAAYHLGWLDADGRPLPGDGVGGKAIRPTLAVLSAQAAGGTAAQGVPAAVAVELVHNFSLLHDDIMDRDVERRHRPTAWVVFGEGQAILAGNAMLNAAVDVLVRDGAAGQRALPSLVAAVEGLIAGQSADLELETRANADLDEVLAMEAGKTAALLACSSSIGALAAGAEASVVDALAGYGYELGMAFQLVDDILGITGDAAATGKSSSSDVRAGKRSAPIVAALNSGTAASEQLAKLLAGGPLTSDDDVTHATKLIDEAGGLEWAAHEADRRLALALGYLDVLSLQQKMSAKTGTTCDLAALARYVVERDR
ncbi:MAG TPA: polyprenyl synthetase family protein [Acidothermaceae bacterium]|jgi:geranylgeranyl diphosphate synthase type I